MRAHVEAVRAAVHTTGRPAFFGVVPSVQVMPYTVVELAGGLRPEVPVSDVSDDWALTVRVKAVAATPEAALTHSQANRAVLVPDGVVADLTVPGRRVWVRFDRHEADYLDRDVVPPRCVSVDTVTVISTPA